MNGSKGEWMPFHHATPTARWRIPETVMPMSFIFFLTIPVLLLPAPALCFPSTLPFVTLLTSDTLCFCPLASFSCSFFIASSFFTPAWWGLFLLADGVRMIAFVTWGGLVVFTDSLADTTWSIPVFGYNGNPAAALPPALDDLICRLVDLLIETAWETKDKITNIQDQFGFLVDICTSIKLMTA